MDSQFWDFSLAIYARPGAAAACLQCQDEAEADVNLVLFLLWRAAAGYRLAENEIASLDEQVAPWRERIVKPLRAIRRELKFSNLDKSGAFRERIKAAELEAERIEQEALSCAVAREARPERVYPPLVAACANLRAYAIVLGRPLPEVATDEILTVFALFVRADQSGAPIGG